MKTHRFRSLLWLVGCLGCAVLADEAADSPTREVLNAFPYQPAMVALPATPAAAPSIIHPDVSPGFVAQEENYRTASKLQPIIAAEDQQQSDALYQWDLPWNTQLKLVERPTVGELVIPWSPMTTTGDVTFSPTSLGSATTRLQARFPVLSLAW